MRITSFALVGALLISLCACVSSHVMIGQARPPISPDAVQIYFHPPATRYDEIALLDTSSRHSFSITAQGKTDAVIARLKEEAAKLGANGVLLGEVRTQQTGSIGTGVGSSSYGPSGGSSVGVGGSFGITNKAASALAIFVPPDVLNAPPPPQPPPVPPPSPQPPQAK